MPKSMKTIYWTVNKNVDNLKDSIQMAEAAQAICQNHLIAFPTETVYGLGANALSEEAVEKVFTAKGRPPDNPLIVHICELGQLDFLAESVSKTAEKCIHAFWPGPLTIIFPAKKGVKGKMTAGLSTVAIRMPDHPVALALIERAKVPIAAPSANRSGRPSPTTAGHVKMDLDGRIYGVIDGGKTGVGIESTVIACDANEVTLLRSGGVTREALTEIVGKDLFERTAVKPGEVPQAPGMKYRHYSPEADLMLVKGSHAFFQSIVDDRRQKGIKVGILTTEEQAEKYQADLVIPCGQRASLTSVAHELFAALRRFDEQQIEEIYSECFPEKGIGQAIMHRLKKSAGGRVIEES